MSTFTQKYLDESIDLIKRLDAATIEWRRDVIGVDT